MLRARRMLVVSSTEEAAIGMKNFAAAFVVVLLSALPAQAQDGSHWGIVGGFVPKWEASSSMEELATFVFTDAEILEGSEFRIGIVRGRTLSGDWGVSFIRKTFDDQNPTTFEEGSGCLGGSTPGGPFILNCDAREVELRPDKLQISGVEVHKFISFGTIKERVQIGLNVAGGIGVGQGGFTTRTTEKTFTCTFPPGAFPDFNNDDVCGGGTRGPERITSVGQGTEPFNRILEYERNLIPLGKVEAAASFIIAPPVKVRVSGGLNYPGISTFGVTGIYLIGAD